MATYYCVKIRTSGFTCVKINSSNKKFILREHKEFNDVESLRSFIKNKNNVNFLLYENKFLKNSISIGREITDRSAINSIVYSKLQKEYPEIDDIRFKSSISDDNKKKDTIKYTINGLYQNSDSYNIFNKLKTFENTNLISLENYSLYSISKSILTDSVFISVWADDKSITIVAGNNKELLYSRNESINESSGTLAQQISKNVIFIKQKLRDVKFDILVLNGTIFENEDVFRSVQEQTRLPISSFYPLKSNYSNISPSNFNIFLLELGSLHIDYSLDFTSSSVKSHRQYSVFLKLLIPILLLIFVYFGNSAYENYFKYENAKNQYNISLNELKALYPELQIDYKNKDVLYNLLDSLQKNSNKELLNQISNIKNNITIVNNSSLGFLIKHDLDNFIWNSNNISRINYSNNMNFNNLNELNEFKQKVIKLQEQLGKSVNIKTDYELTNLKCSIAFTFYGEYK